jgi:hypothetical protein
MKSHATDDIDNKQNDNDIEETQIEETQVKKSIRSRSRGRGVKIIVYRLSYLSKK